MKKIFNISITVIITVTTVILGAFVFRNSYLRLWETLRDFGLSVAYYFSLIFKGESDITPTVNFSRRADICLQQRKNISNK